MRSRSNLQHAHIELVADIDHFGRMAHALPGHVGDVQQAVDTAEVDECAVIGEVLDHALDHGAFLQALEQLLRAPRECSLSTTARRETTTLLRLRSSLMILNSSSLPSRYDGIAHRAHVDQRTGQERADVLDVDGETALDLAGDAPGDGLVASCAFFQFVPDHRALGLLARRAWSRRSRFRWRPAPP